MFKELAQITQKPDAFSAYTADKLWTEPHLASRMLEAHLDQNSPLASRSAMAVDRVTSWINNRFQLDGKLVCDLGCGPGFYAEKYAEVGAIVQGMDFSRNSIKYARRNAAKRNTHIHYLVANYLTDALPTQQDLVTLIYCDLCALSPAQRSILLSKIHDSLNPDGTFLFDVMSKASFDDYIQRSVFARNYMHGFWSPNDYFAFHHSHRYEKELVSLDRFTIIEEHSTWEIYNWMQYFTPDSIAAELFANGFEVVDVTTSFDVDEDSEHSFGIVAKKHP